MTKTKRVKFRKVPMIEISFNDFSFEGVITNENVEGEHIEHIDQIKGLDKELEILLLDKKDLSKNIKKWYDELLSGGCKKNGNIDMFIKQSWDVRTLKGDAELVGVLIKSFESHDLIRPRYEENSIKKVTLLIDAIK